MPPLLPFGRRRREADLPSEARDAASGVEELPPEARVEALRAYHRATAHDFHRFAAGPGWLDWANQPDPFRRFDGAPAVALPLAEGPGAARYDEALLEGARDAEPLDLARLGALLQDALGVTAWKEYEGARWALRADPSSGNLHPTEAHLVLPPLPGLAGVPTVAHYAPRAHALELRAELDPARHAALLGGLPAGTLVVVLSSIAWREAWKYGERAYRYCQHDVGHALAALSLSAGALGWETRALREWGSGALSRGLGLDAAHPDEAERADCALAVGPGPLDARPGPFAPGVEAWRGAPNRLSEEHVEWRAVELAAELCARPDGVARRADAPPPAPPVAVARTEPFRAVARRRRSAVAMDGRTPMARADFMRALARTLPAAGARPFASLPGPPRVALGLFVHRVEGLEPGLYALCRAPGQAARLRPATRAGFLWEPDPDAAAAPGLFRLTRGDVRGVASAVSCQQEIAGGGAFAAAMLAEFAGPLAEEGAWVYPELHWECGAIGQVLYLEAEAAGLRATGIGCFFDRATHEVFGLEDEAFRTLYHFTVGGPVEDARLTTRPAYPAPE